MNDSRTRQLARSTIAVIIAFGLAKAVSLLQIVLIAKRFGISADQDTFVAANAIPETIFNLIAGGVLIHAFLPLFTGFLAKDETDKAWRLASQVLNTVFLLTLVVSAIAFITAPWLVSNILAPGMTPELATETANLMRVLLLSTLIFSVSGLLMGILNSFGYFFAPALAPTMYDLGILFGAIFLVAPFGIYGLAYGRVLGALLHLGIQIPFVLRIGVRWRPILNWKDETFRRMVRLMIPRIADLGLFQITNAILITNIASRLGESAISALGWSWQIMQIPETLIGTAIGTVIFPTLAALSEIGDKKNKTSAMAGALRFILATTIPSAIFLILAGQAGISLLERGAFTSENTLLVYNALRFYALGVIVHSLLEVVARSFYAEKDTITPFWVALGGATINIVFALLLTGVLTGNTTSQGVGGLALANTLGVTFEVSALLFILRRRWGDVHLTALGRTALKTLAASLVMGVVIVAIDALGLAGRGTLWTIIQLGLQGVLGLIAFAITAYFLKMEELDQVWAFLRRKTEKVNPDVA